MIGFNRRAEGPVLVELLSIFNQQLTLALFGALIIGTVTLYVIWGRVPASYVLIWYGVLVLVTLLQAREIFLHRRGPKDDRVSQRIWTMVLLCAVSGVNWGVGGMVFLDGHDALITVYLSVLLTGMVAGSLAPLSPLPPTFVFIATLSILPMAIKLMTYGDTTLLIIGLLLVFFVLVNIGYVKEFHDSLVSTILLRFENVELLAQLTREKERAEESEEAKSRFLAAASHDLRQPLNALRLFVEVLGHEQVNDKVEHLRGRIAEAAQGVTMIVDGVLDLSKIEAGEEQARIVGVPVNDIFDLLRMELSHEAEAKGLKLTVRPCQAVVFTDPEILLRILRNLTSNALRYTEKGGVLVGCRLRGDKLRFEVWDTGIGIAPDQLDKVFKEYYQIDNQERDRSKGLGLGLSIVRALADLLGTKVEVSSQPGRGSNFYFSQSVGNPEARTITEVPDDRAVEEAPRRVVILDDDALSLEAMAQLVSSWGHDVIAVQSIDALNEALRPDTPYDLLVSDFRLQGAQTGLDAVAMVIQVLGRTIPVMFVTGDTDPGLLEMAATSGHPLMHKPLDPIALRAAINGLAP